MRLCKNLQNAVATTYIFVLQDGGADVFLDIFPYDYE